VVDLHAPQLQGFFNIPVDHLFASPVLVDYFKEAEPAEPDGGFAGRRWRGAGAVFSQKKVDAALAIVDKRRVEVNVAEVMNVIGEVNGRTCLIIDDLIRHGGNAGESGAGAR